jgi:hypothetical protein
MPQMTYTRDEVRALLHQAQTDCAQRSQILQVLQGDTALPIVSVQQSSNGIVVRVGTIGQGAGA